MTFDRYFQSLNSEERDAFAESANLSRRYIENHLVYRRKSPKASTLYALSRASNHLFSAGELFEWFNFEQSCL